MARAKAGAIFKKSDITHVMRPVFNAPMSPNQFKQALETSLLPRKGGDDVNHLKGGLASLFGGDSAGELSHLSHSRPISLQVVRKSASHFDVTDFLASTLQVRGLSFFKRGRWISKIGRQMLMEGRLVVFDHQHGVPL